MGLVRFAAALCLCLVPLPAVAQQEDCGGDVACAVADGQYLIEMPPGGNVRGAYIFFHGYRSSAASQMSHRALVDTAHAHGFAFVAPDGREGTWSHPGSPTQVRDERAFIASVLDDLDTRFGFGAEDVVVGGFSQGGSMAWYAACQLGGRMAATITFAGVFWGPPPEPADCVSNLPPMVHFHGAADTVFPLEGRPIGSDFMQGDTRESIAIVAERAACQSQASVEQTIASVDCTIAPACRRGAIALCIHEGGHSVSAAQLSAAFDELGF